MKTINQIQFLKFMEIMSLLQSSFDCRQKSQNLIRIHCLNVTHKLCLDYLTISNNISFSVEHEQQIILSYLPFIKTNVILFTQYGYHLDSYLIPLRTLVSKLILLPDISNKLTWDDIRLATVISDRRLEPTSNTYNELSPFI